MKIVSVINQKGGAGKTTLALHLAVASSTAGRNTAVLDLDPQASAAKWADRPGDCQSLRLGPRPLPAVHPRPRGHDQHT